MSYIETPTHAWDVYINNYVETSPYAIPLKYLINTYGAGEHILDVDGLSGHDRMTE